MTPKKRDDAGDNPQLFNDLPTIEPEPKIKQLPYPIWTENKARLIERYLYYFVMITHHGTYIDGFAGPQEPDKPHTWAAKLVLESEPRWFRHFFLCDKDQKQHAALEQLAASQPQVRGRTVELFHGDFNSEIDSVLSSRHIDDKQATFCLLDQRTLQCHWATLAKLATHKRGGNKIEIFYFLGVGWLHRSLAASKGPEPHNWWGRDDWAKLKDVSKEEVAREFESRFKSEFGYKSVKSWPIYETTAGGNVMYFMVHATDHPKAPGLMRRAYERAVLPKETKEQFLLELQYEEP